MGVTEKQCERGQATVELLVCLPVMLVVAVIAVNALTFFSECAAFDRLAHQAIRVHAAAPAYGEDAAGAAQRVSSALQESFDRENLTVSVASESRFGGHASFTATLEYAPTLFGLGIRSQVLGVQIPPLTHSVTYVIDTYKPGVLV